MVSASWGPWEMYRYLLTHALGTQGVCAIRRYLQVSLLIPNTAQVVLMVSTYLTQLVYGYLSSFLNRACHGSLACAVTATWVPLNIRPSDPTGRGTIFFCADAAVGSADMAEYPRHTT